MQHARVGVYTLKPGTADEAIRRAEAGALPTLRRQPGFVGYGLIKAGEDAVISRSLWESHEQAVQIAAAGMEANAAEMLDSVQNHVFSSTAPVGS